MKIVPVPCLDDNYAYLIIDPATGIAAAVDPVSPQKVKETAELHGASISCVLTTHHHWDHAGGNLEMKKIIPALEVYGGDLDRVEGSTHGVKHGEDIFVGSNIHVKALHTPCHTKGHISYYVTVPGEDPAVFTGDTLFIAGCGRFFEGTAQQMYESLLNTLGSLPKATRVFCGHEYTVKNLQFAATVEPDNKAVDQKLSWARTQRQANKPTVPSTIGEEFEINPFMRVESTSLQMATGRTNPVEVMAQVRRMKDQF